jgi:formyltetrahydrofolate hydrolase
VLQGRQDLNTSSTSSTAELALSLETLVSNWSNLQKKVDTKVSFYTDIHTLHEDLKSTRSIDMLIDIVRMRSSCLHVDLLHQENVWLDSLQNKIYSSINNGADAEEIAEELDVKYYNLSTNKHDESILLFVDC